MDTNTLRMWALGAEVVSALAIIVTLGFLVIEMRANTVAIHHQTYQVLTEQLNEYRTTLVGPGGLEAREKLRVQGWDSLTRIEQDRVRFPTINLFGVYESAFYARQRGVIGLSEWERFATAICRNYRRNLERGSWAPDGGFTPFTELLTPDFVQHIEESCM